MSETAPKRAESTAMQHYIDSLETAERIKHYPHLTERAPNVEIDDFATADDDEGNGEDVVSVRNQGLQSFSLVLLSTFTSNLHIITKLDVSNNELSTLPGLSSLTNLETLNLRRNWFSTLPNDIGKLCNLRVINASRNFLKPTNDSLQFDRLKALQHLVLLDIRMNQKCRTAEHRQFITRSIKQSDNTTPSMQFHVLVSIWQEMSDQPGCIGLSAALRDATLLRSQLEPLGTVQLRRRLVRDFGQPPTDPETIGRAEVMKILLDCYRKEKLLSLDDDVHDLNLGVAKRPVVRFDGFPVRQELLDLILKELRDWRHNQNRGGSNTNRERPSIKAECYMILRAPSKNGNNTTSRQEKRRQKKMKPNQHLWNLAMQAITETDPEFASRCSEIAVTYNFIGSPHIDRQNSSHFYGLSLGNFNGGCIVVEISPRVVGEVNTQNRLGKVDGRYPHWVSEYDTAKEERFSLIYYDTISDYQVPGPAVFCEAMSADS